MSNGMPSAEAMQAYQQAMLADNNIAIGGAPFRFNPPASPAMSGQQKPAEAINGSPHAANMSRPGPYTAPSPAANMQSQAAKPQQYAQMDGNMPPPSLGPAGSQQSRRPTPGPNANANGQQMQSQPAQAMTPQQQADTPGPSASQQGSPVLPSHQTPTQNSQPNGKDKSRKRTADGSGTKEPPKKVHSIFLCCANELLTAKYSARAKLLELAQNRYQYRYLSRKVLLCAFVVAGLVSRVTSYRLESTSERLSADFDAGDSSNDFSILSNVGVPTSANWTCRDRRKYFSLYFQRAAKFVAAELFQRRSALR